MGMNTTWIAEAIANGPQMLRDAMKGCEGRIDYLTDPVRNDLGSRARLKRPDGIVVWASAGDPDTEMFRQTATRWFGRPKYRSNG
jgi:hypothetical protein